MGRLLSWPVGLKWVSREPLAGPRTRGAAASESGTGYVQTIASPFGLWRWQFTFPPLRGRALRQWRGTVTALHGGANAIRVPFCDPDGMGWAQLGVTITPAQIMAGLPWSNGRPWSNGMNWHVSRPTVAVAAAAAKGASIITLANTTWGHAAELGVMFGFGPYHFGLYTITEVIAPGQYRIWPPLRKALATSDFATLEPVMAMRLESEAAANAGRGPAFANSLSATFVEVTDDLVRKYFAG